MRLLLLSLALLAPLAYAETVTGRVVGIADGDTLTILDASNQQHRIRLSGIDAPGEEAAFRQPSKAESGFAGLRQERPSGMVQARPLRTNRREGYR